LHVYVRLVPRWDSYAVRAAAVAVAQELERRRPDVITVAWWKEERGARIFVIFTDAADKLAQRREWTGPLGLCLGLGQRRGDPVGAPERAQVGVYVARFVRRSDTRILERYGP
jgi:hypothetical protein